jgi:hypothetical protein
MEQRFYENLTMNQNHKSKQTMKPSNNVNSNEEKQKRGKWKTPGCCSLNVNKKSTTGSSGTIMSQTKSYNLTENKVKKANSIFYNTTSTSHIKLRRVKTDSIYLNASNINQASRTSNQPPILKDIVKQPALYKGNVFLFKLVFYYKLSLCCILIVLIRSKL